MSAGQGEGLSLEETDPSVQGGLVVSLAGGRSHARLIDEPAGRRCHGAAALAGSAHCAALRCTAPTRGAGRILQRAAALRPAAPSARPGHPWRGSADAAVGASARLGPPRPGHATTARRLD